MPKVREHLYLDKTHRGDPRYRFRWDRDSKRISIKGNPGEPEFEREYERLKVLHQHGIDPSAKGDRNDGTFAWLANKYMSEMDTMVDRGLMAHSTRKQRVNLFKRCTPKWGHGHVLTLRPEHVRAMMSDFRTTPGQANNLLKALRAMFAYAIEMNFMSGDPAIGVKRYKTPEGGFTAWSRKQLRAFLAAHPVGTTPHLAMMLLIGTACRRSDLVLLGPGHVVDEGRGQFISFVQAKHGFADASRVTVPLIRPLEEALDKTPIGNETFLISANGEPFSKFGFGDRFRKWCDAADLPKELSCHGVRKAVGALLADSGCTEHEIMAFHGHADARTSEIYTRTANRKRLANNAAVKASLYDLLGNEDAVD